MLEVQRNRPCNEQFLFTLMWKPFIHTHAGLSLVTVGTVYHHISQNDITDSAWVCVLGWWWESAVKHGWDLKVWIIQGFLCWLSELRCFYSKRSSGWWIPWRSIRWLVSFPPCIIVCLTTLISTPQLNSHLKGPHVFSFCHMWERAFSLMVPLLTYAILAFQLACTDTFALIPACEAHTHLTELQFQCINSIQHKSGNDLGSLYFLFF